MLSPVVADPAAGKDQQFRDAAFFLGDAQFQAGQFADSAKTLAAYLAADGPRKEEGAFKLGLAQLKAGQTGEAEKTLAKLADAPAGPPGLLAGSWRTGSCSTVSSTSPTRPPVCWARCWTRRPMPRPI
jgi:hypothetical protein